MSFKFQIGDKVAWQTVSKGVRFDKKGAVELVLPPNTRPPANKRREADVYGQARECESYMVRVGTKSGRGKGQLYWPKESLLHPSNMKESGHAIH